MAKRKKKKKSKLKRFLWLLILLFVAAIAFIVYQHKKEKKSIDIKSLTKLPLPKGFSVLGIDVSHHNGDINWEAVAAQGVSFAYIKSTEGISIRDKDFESNYEQAKKLGIKVGLYHFFIFSKDAIEQAKHFIDESNYVTGDLPPAIDIEYSPLNIRKTDKNELKKRIQSIRDFADYVKDKLKVRPVLYTHKQCYDDLIKNNFPRYDVWLCDLSREPDFDVYPNWTIWQYSQEGKLAGIDTKVDINVYYADQNEFLNWLDN